MMRHTILHFNAIPFPKAAIGKKDSPWARVVIVVRLPIREELALGVGGADDPAGCLQTRWKGYRRIPRVSMSLHSINIDAFD